MSTARDRRIADDFLADHLPCNRCATSTPRDDLATFGAMCRTCYAAYCAECNPRWWPNRELTADERAAVIKRAKSRLAKLGERPDPKRWAHRLREREEAGKPLGLVQRRFSREVLGEPAQPTTEGETA